MKYFEGSICVKHCELEHWHNVIIQRQNFKQSWKCLNDYCRYYYEDEIPEKQGESFWFPYSLVTVSPGRLIEIDDVGQWKQQQFDNAMI
jgi:hypothetical protein